MTIGVAAADDSGELASQDESASETPGSSAGVATEANPTASPPFETPRRSLTAPLALYLLAAGSIGPLLAPGALRRRAARGKEDPARLRERFGEASLPRPDGPLVWLHAASMGEALSLLPLIDALRAHRPDLGLLVTTGTVTSARTMATRLPPDVPHQYAPIDTGPALRRFLAHWRPCFLGVVESEIWPNMLRATRRHGARLALISARVSAKSAAIWARAPRSIRSLLDGFDAILAQDEEVAARLSALGADAGRLSIGGSLKQAAKPLPADPSELEAMRTRLAGRPIWLAASTHEGEEAAALDAHVTLAKTRPNLLTVIAPRHPERGAAVAEAAAAAGLRATRRALGQQPNAGDAVHVVDSLGELGLWFRLCPCSFVGGSLVPVGGHNPLEPARLGSATVVGPHLSSVEREATRLEAAGALIRAADAADLAAALDRLVGHDDARSEEAARIGQAGLVATAEDGAVVARYLAALEPLLPPRAGASR
ncbi:MAG: 3-deoxy-D-manno-octulosonic acid transferase [Pseudomonadota bacterium]